MLVCLDADRETMRIGGVGSCLQIDVDIVFRVAEVLRAISIGYVASRAEPDVGVDFAGLGKLLHLFALALCKVDTIC